MEKKHEQDFQKGKSMKSSKEHRTEPTRKPLWTLLGLTMLAGVGVTLSACNTVEGVGRDVESVGDNIADTADDAKD